MKVIELKVLEGTDVAGNNPRLVYKDTLTELLSGGGTDGLSIGDVRKSMKVLEVIESSNGELWLEDDLHSHMMMRLESIKYSKVFKNLIQFMDDMQHAPARKVEDQHHEHHFEG